MLGFVSALASALAAIILLMVSSLMQLAFSYLEEEEKRNYLVVQDIQVAEDDSDGFYGQVLSGELIMQLKDSKELRIVCTFGNNYSEDVSRRISVFNFILAKKILNDNIIHLEKPMYEPNKKNTCYIKGSESGK